MPCTSAHSDSALFPKCQQLVTACPHGSDQQPLTSGKFGTSIQHNGLSVAYDVCAVPRQVTYADLGGIDSILSDIRELIEHPLQHPEVCSVKVITFSHVVAVWIDATTAC